MSKTVLLAPLTSLTDQPLLSDVKHVTNYVQHVIFPENVVTNTQFIMLQMQELSSVGHRLSHNCVTSFNNSDLINIYLKENLQDYYFKAQVLLLKKCHLPKYMRKK